MADVVIGLLHPGEMGSALASVLRSRGNDVLWASAGRSRETTHRAERAGLRDVGTIAELRRLSDVIFSVCPPHAALEVARSASGFDGVFLDANAVSPATVREIAGVIDSRGARCVDGGIIGPPPAENVTTHLCLSGPSAQAAAGLFEGTVVDTRIISDRIGSASAVKMAYAAWTKGTAALLLAIRTLARVEGIEAALLAEWQASLPELPADSLRAARSAAQKGWRWIGEMEEIAATFAAADLPYEFHRAAAEIFRRAPRLDDPNADAETLDRILAALATDDSHGAPPLAR